MFKGGNKNLGAKKFKGDEYAIPIYTPRSTYNAIRLNGMIYYLVSLTLTNPVRRNPLE